jgi:hypothetical protein
LSTVHSNRSQPKTDSGPTFRALITSLAIDFEILWVVSLALVCSVITVLVCARLLHFAGEKLEWATYLSLGTIFPALLLVFTLPSIRRRFSIPLDVVKLVMTASWLVFAIVALPREGQAASFVFSAAHVVLLIIFFKKLALPINRTRIVVALIVVLVSWTLSVRFLWWSFFSSWIYQTGNTAGVVYRLLVCALALLVVFLNLVHEGVSDAIARFRFWSVGNVVAILIFALASFSSDQKFDLAGSYSHWGVIVGPAGMVRQGAWLLNDAPSQYGFLSTLTVALLPFETVWQSLYVLNSVLLLLSSSFLFYIFRSLRTGPANFIFALLITLAAVFLLPGYLYLGYAPQAFPMLGPFRFGWVYALLAVLFWEFRSSEISPAPRVLLLGTLIWLLGSLWSSESAAYCAAVWLPAYALLILRRAVCTHRKQRSSKKSLNDAVAWLLLPLLTGTSAVVLINFYYLLTLGHSADWRGFYEYSFSSIVGFFALPSGIDTPVLTLLLIFCLTSAVVAHFLRRGLTPKPVSLLAGTWGALWAMSSYYVSRSHPNNANALTPMLCFSMGIALYLLVRYQAQDWWRMTLRMSLVPFLTIILIMTFANTSFLKSYFTGRVFGYQRNINLYLPRVDSSLSNLMTSSGVKPSDPLIYCARGLYAAEPPFDGLSIEHGVLFPVWIGDDCKQVVSPAYSWLPTAPLAVLAPLAEDRRQEYMARFATRAKLSGWLVQSKHEAPYTSLPWFQQQLMRTHSPTKIHENEDWQLIWFEYQEGRKLARR